MLGTVIHAWNNGKEVPRWGVAEIQKMSPSTTGRCSRQTADQWERGTATRQPITQICSPGVVELVRSNLAPDFPLFHDPAPDLMNVTSLLSRTVLDFNFETLPHTVLVHCIIPASLIAESACATPELYAFILCQYRA